MCIHMNTRYKNILMWVLYGLLFVLVMVLQTVIFGHARYWDTKLSLIPVAIACVAMHCGAENGGVFGLAAGLVWCFSGADGGALVIVLCTLCALAAGHLCDHILNRNLVSALLMCLMALVGFQFVLLALKLYLGQTGAEGLWVFCKQVLLSMLACPPLYFAAWIIRKVGNHA